MSLFMLVTCGYAAATIEFFKYDGIERLATSQERCQENSEISKFLKIHSEINGALKTS